MVRTSRYYRRWYKNPVLPTLVPTLVRLLKYNPIGTLVPTLVAVCHMGNGLLSTWRVSLW